MSVTTEPRTRMTSTVARFWQFMLTYGLAVVLVSAIHWGLFGPRVGAVALFVMLLVWWAILSFGQAWFVPYWVEDWVVELVRLGPGRNRNWQVYDWTELERQTQELQARGFVRLHDYRRLRPDRSPRLGQWQTFARCFAHPDLGSYAEIGFRLMPMVPPNVAIGEAAVNVLYTVFCSCFEADWLLIDSNLAPHRRESLLYAWRHPREVRNYYPSLHLALLCDRYQENRAQLMQQRSLQPLQTATWEAYCALQRERIIQPWQRLRQRNLLSAMIEATRFERRPADRWLPR